MYNKIIGIGHLVKDPESRTTSTGKQVTTLRVCISDSKAQNKCFIDCECWDRLAEVCSQFLKKGREVMVEGELCSSSWTGKDGSTQTKMYIRADKVKFMNSSPKTESGDESSDSVQKTQAPKKNFSKPKQQTEEIDSEDIPF